MKIALAQINTTVWDFAGNRKKICAYAQQALEAGAGLVVFPELCVCGYPPEDLSERPGFWADNRRALEKLAAELPAIPAIVGYVTKVDGAIGKPAQNRAAILSEGKILFEQAKTLLPTYDVLDEARYFEPATDHEIFNLNGTRIALTICEDAWNDKTFWNPQPYACDPVETLMEQGSDVLINISASPFSQGKRTLRREMFQATARRYQVPVILVNHVGGNDSLIFDGSSLAVDLKGEVRAEAKSFEEDLVFFDTESGEGDIHKQPEEGIAEIFHALRFGLKEYVHKCGFEKVVIGLSGGIDSTVVAALAVGALGPDHVAGIALPSPYSASSSLLDAERLAGNLGIEFHAIEIKDAFETYKKTLAPIFAGMEEDVTEENLQARIRGNFLMAYSNKFGALMLSTGNKSELAVGYCTLYGDLAGGLAVISDVPKTMVYELARYINARAEWIPSAILSKAPTAELQPNQFDQDVLPPYEILDSILLHYIEYQKTPEEIIEQQKLNAKVVRDVIRRIHISEHKRRQAPPGLKVTEKAFGLGRRYPIAKKYTPPD